jgi:hypothetical protein
MDGSIATSMSVSSDLNEAVNSQDNAHSSFPPASLYSYLGFVDLLVNQDKLAAHGVAVE